MSIKAEITKTFGTLTIKAAIVQITRGVGATIDYRVSVWATNDAGFSDPIPGGESLLSDQMLSAVKTELWESIRP